MAVYTIYCLIDPRTNHPFYIGATSYPMRLRLQGHVSLAVNERTKLSHRITDKRGVFIAEMIKSGNAPIIKALFVVSSEHINLMERSFYWLFTNSGINLMQSPYHFTYEQHKV